MNTTDLKQAQDPFILKVNEALKQAAQLAREEAIKTNTGIIISKNGKVVEVSAEELKKQQINTSSRD